MNTLHNNVPEQTTYSYNAGILQGKAYSRLHTALTQAIAEFGISIPEWKLLGQLHAQGKINHSKLARTLGYDLPLVTRLVNKLEEKGHVSRQTCSTDERAKIICLTGEGEQIVESAEIQIRKAMKTILDGVSHDDLAIYLKVLNTIVVNTQK